MRKNQILIKTLMATAIALSSNVAMSQGFVTEETPMMKGVTKNIKNNWKVRPLVTVGETNNAMQDVNSAELGYRLPGILDGIGAFYRSPYRVQVLVNSELSGNEGYTYSLSNGTPLTGARITSVDIFRKTRTIKKMSLAYDRVFDRFGKIVTNASQINEGSSTGPNDGFSRLCSATGIKAGALGFTRDVFFAGEETSNGQMAALDVNARDIYVVPMMGRAGFENVAAIANYGTNKVAMIIADDRGGAPLLLYVGEKGTVAQNYPVNLSFLKNNGLANGQLYVWVSDDFAVNGERDYTTFNGTGNIRNGRFVKFDHFLPALKGTAGFDAFGFPFQTQQDSLANLKNYFKFSRPEDVETNPNDPTQVIFASTGLSSIFNGVDSWGTTYLIDFNDSSLMAKLNMPLSQIDNIEASLKVVYDGNDAGGGLFSGPDFGLRSPDNLTWASNGMVYLQEDKSVTGFGLTSGMEASVFELDPMSGAMARILEMDRNAVPFMQSDVAITDLGNWESSGILDVTNLFETKPGEVVLLFDVQAHSAANGLINGSANLVQGGQLCLATKIFPMVQSSNKSIATSNVTESESKEDLVFPNPAVDKLNFIERNTGTVKNAEGKEVLKFTATNNIDIQTLPVGVYTVIFANGSESKFVKK